MDPAEADRRGALLIRIARRHLTRLLRPKQKSDPRQESDERQELQRQEPWLFEPGAVFVTLKRRGDLRGCVGSLRADRPLFEDLCDNAEAAATRDSRFSALAAAELDEVEIEVTRLSAPEPMSFTSEAEALAQLRPGVDGVVLRWGEKHATYLPQVWDGLPEPEQFLAQLKRKAGLAADFWDGEIRLERYRAQKWSESGPTVARQAQ